MFAAIFLSLTLAIVAGLAVAVLAFGYVLSCEDRPIGFPGIDPQVYPLHLFSTSTTHQANGASEHSRQAA